MSALLSLSCFKILQPSGISISCFRSLFSTEIHRSYLVGLKLIRLAWVDTRPSQKNNSAFLHRKLKCAALLQNSTIPELFVSCVFFFSLSLPFICTCISTSLQSLNERALPLSLVAELWHCRASSTTQAGNTSVQRNIYLADFFVQCFTNAGQPY